MKTRNQRVLGLSRVGKYLLCIWIVVLSYGEVLCFANTCAWPSGSAYSSYDLAINPLKRETKMPTQRVVVIGDPQLTDATSYWFIKGLALRLVEFYSDLFMRRAYMLNVLSLQPDVVAFVGDLFDGGRQFSSTDEFQLHLRRFQSVFRMENSMKFVFAAGNHDVGLGRFYSTPAAKRWELTFGRRNFTTSVCQDLDIVVIDSIGLSASTKQQEHEKLQAKVKT